MPLEETGAKIQKMNSAKKIFFYRQLSALLESGVNILRALELLAKQERGKLRTVLHYLHKSIESGSSFTQAISIKRDVFSDFEISIIHSGEITGNLENSFRLIAEYFEKTTRRQRKFFLGMVYPIILLHLAILIPPIRFLILEGLVPYLRAVSQPLIYMYLIFFLILAGLKIIRRSAFLSTLRDRILWSTPIIGGIIRKLGISRFATSLALSLRAGLNPDLALKTSSQASGSAVIKLAISKSERFLHEEGIAEVLRKTGIFPYTVIEVALTGEKSGKIDEMLLRIASSLEDEATTAINTLLVIAPVVIYLAVALYIAWVIISFYVGYFQKILPH